MSRPCLNGKSGWTAGTPTSAESAAPRSASCQVGHTSVCPSRCATRRWRPDRPPWFADPRRRRTSLRRLHRHALARTAFTPCCLHSQGRANSFDGNGTLTPDAPGAEPPDQYDYDPDNPVPTLDGNNSTWTMMKFAEPIYPGPVDQRPLEGRDDVLVYTTPELERDLEVTGPLEVILYAASSARDTDFTAKLVDVYPDGRAIHIAEGILRARHRHSLARVEFLQRGEPDQFRIALAPTSNLFARGHRVRLEIYSSNFPRFDRNLNTAESIATGTSIQIARQTVLHSSEYPSHILLPVVPE